MTETSFKVSVQSLKYIFKNFKERIRIRVSPAPDKVSDSYDLPFNTVFHHHLIII